MSLANHNSVSPTWVQPYFLPLCSQPLRQAVPQSCNTWVPLLSQHQQRMATRDSGGLSLMLPQVFSLSSKVYRTRPPRGSQMGCIKMDLVQPGMFSFLTSTLPSLSHWSITHQATQSTWTPTKSFTLVNHKPGDAVDMDAYHAELGGIYIILATTNELCKSFGMATSAMLIGCDC